MVKIRHSKNVVDNVERMREVMTQADAYFQKATLQFNILADTLGPSPIVLASYIKEVFGMKPPKDQEELSTKTQNKLDQIIDLVLHGDGNDRPNVRGTWWAAYNGVTQYLNYEASRQTETRLKSLWFGQGAKLNSYALSLALDYCTGEVAA